LRNLVSFYFLTREEGSHSCLSRKTLQCDEPDRIKNCSPATGPPFSYSRPEVCRGTFLVVNAPSTASLICMTLDNYLYKLSGERTKSEPKGSGPIPIIRSVPSTVIRPLHSLYDQPIPLLCDKEYPLSADMCIGTP